MQILKLVEKNQNEFEITNNENQVFFHYTYLEDCQCSIQKWQGYLKDDNILYVYKQLSLFAIERKHLIKASISDISETQNSFHLTNKWVAEELIPKSIPHGYQYALFIKPKEFFAELALEDAVDLLSAIEGLKEVKIFESLEDGLAYAKTLP